MRLDQNDRIRLNIMSIAILSGVVFVLYIAANFWVVKTNEHHIDDLQKNKFPIIENLILLKEDVSLLREALSNAIILENQFLIEEALDLAPAFQKRLEVIKQLLGKHHSKVVEIHFHFNAYKILASKLATKLVENPHNLDVYQHDAAATHKTYQHLNTSINDLLAEQQMLYRDGLNSVNHDINTTNNVAALVGAIFVVGMIALTWLTSNKVMCAIKRADKLKESFLITISHELRTPMNGILGALSLLKTSKLEPSQRTLIEIANSSSMAMIKSVDDILTFTELMSGKPKLMISPFDQSDWVADLNKIAEQQCLDKNLTYKFESDLDDLVIVSDKRKLIRVCRQLLENAVKFTTSGVIVFRISHTLNEDMSGELQVEVEDHGPGFSHDLMKDIFKPFLQAEGGFKRSYQGIGIGLAMSNAIIRGMGGTLNLQNKLANEGSVVEFTVPTHFLSPDLSQDKAKETLSELVEISAPNVLIVEDNKVNQIILDKIINKMDCVSLLANNGQEALEQVTDEEVDLILMDCQMPVMDGFEATEAIRKLASSKRNIPIIAVTANTRDEDRARCFAVGMNGFLSKPVDFESVQQAVETHLQQRA